jgi:DNA polymerase III subunit delta'
MTRLEGHDDVIRIFRQAVERGRLGHAYMLVGPKGIGKRRFAELLAQILLCENRDGRQFDPCGACAACHLVLAETHPDLMKLGRRSDEHELPIESIRQVIHDLGFKPDRGRYKVAIVDDADDLNEASANCFLKCLEEPPPLSLILLIATSPDLQLATIRSRCQIVRFQPLPSSIVARVLIESGVVADQSEADRLAQMSGGSLERARGLAEPELWSFRSELARSLASGRVDTLGLAESMSALIDSVGKESAEKRARAKLLFGIAAELLHTSLRAAVGARDQQTDHSIRPLVEQIAQKQTPESIVSLIEHCLNADYRIDRMGSVPLVVEAWADQVASS